MDDQEERNTNNANPVLNQNQINNTLHNPNLEFVLPGEKTKSNNNNDKFNTSNNNTLNLHQDKQINNNGNNNVSNSKDGVYASKTAAHYNLKSLAHHLKVCLGFSNSNFKKILLLLFLLYYFFL